MQSSHVFMLSCARFPHSLNLNHFLYVLRCLHFVDAFHVFRLCSLCFQLFLVFGSGLLKTLQFAQFCIQFFLKILYCQCCRIVVSMYFMVYYVLHGLLMCLNCVLMRLYMVSEIVVNSLRMCLYVSHCCLWFLMSKLSSNVVIQLSLCCIWCSQYDLNCVVNVLQFFSIVYLAFSIC